MFCQRGLVAARIWHKLAQSSAEPEFLEGRNFPRVTVGCVSTPPELNPAMGSRLSGHHDVAVVMKDLCKTILKTEVPTAGFEKPKSG